MLFKEGRTKMEQYKIIELQIDVSTKIKDKVNKMIEAEKQGKKDIIF